MDYNAESDPVKRQDLFIFQIASYVTVFVLVGLVVLHGSSANNIELTISELLAAAAISLNVFLFGKVRNLMLAKFLFMTTILCLMLTHVTTGGYAFTGLYWVFIFPIIAVFVYRGRAGILWIITLYIALLTTILLASSGNLYIPFTQAQMLEMMTVLSAVTLAVMIYRKSVMDLEAKLSEASIEIDNEKTRLHAILSQMQDGVIVTDASGHVQLLNPAAEDMLGYTEKELLNKSWLESVDAVDDDGVEVARDKRPERHVLKRHQRTRHTLINFRRKDGSIITVDALGNIYKINGKLTGAIASIRDVTALHKADRAKSDFVNLASHQLRTPLSSIRWHAELLMDEGIKDLKGDQQESLRSIDESAKKMSLLVNDLLSMARIESGSIMSSRQKVSLQTLVEHVSSEFEAEATERKISIELKSLSKIPPFSTNESALHQCIASLIDNAIKYSHDDSSVVISASQEDDGLIIKVKDSGIGIPENQHTAIFQKFHRASNATKHRTDGTGLGLYLAKSLVEILQGEIWFDTAINKGTSFYIRIPVDQKQQ